MLSIPLLVAALSVQQTRSDLDADAALALAAAAQQYQPKVVTPPPPPPKKEPVATQEKTLSYLAARELAIQQRKPLVLFIGCTPLKLAESVVVCAVPEGAYAPDYPSRCVVVTYPGEGNQLPFRGILPASENAASIMATAVPPRREVSQNQASPFQPGPSAPPTADGKTRQATGPWLAEEENVRLRKLLRDRGVPASDNLKFYSIPAKRQEMYSVSSVAQNDILPADAEKPWATSGGMHHVNRRDWRNVTGLDLSGPIAYWQEPTDVRAYVLVPKHRWRFPTGTLAYDVLLRTRDGEDQNVFEVRVQEKLESGWDDGTTYRPSVNTEEATDQGYKWQFSSSYYADGHVLDAVANVKHVPKIDPNAAFKPARTVAVDDEFTPPGYVGAGLSCNKCHNHAGEVKSVRGRIYREALRGDDGRFSWHPFTDGGGIDWRWPLVRGKPSQVASRPKIEDNREVDTESYVPPRQPAMVAPQQMPTLRRGR